MKNYKLETVIQAYNLGDKVLHRALDDAKIILRLASKLNELMQKLK